MDIMRGFKDVFSKNQNNIDLSEKRMKICRNCDFFNKITTQCSYCGCFMKVKTKIVEIKCPVGKW